MGGLKVHAEVAKELDLKAEQRAQSLLGVGFLKLRG